jgi:formamidopyrimidine-DNA glycosylase
MPELPEVEIVCRALQQTIANQTIKTVTIYHYHLRWPISKNLSKILCGQKILAIHRRSKYILIELNSGTLIIHLGMSGHIRLFSPPLPTLKNHDHYDIIFSNNILLRYHDPRRFGALLWTDQPAELHPLLTKIGVEPLTEKFNGQYLYQQIHKRKCNIKTILMNSHIVAGIGNIYANEALFIAGIHPSRLGLTLSLEECQTLCKAAKQVLQQAILVGGTTLNDFVHSNGDLGRFSQQLLVYSRKNEPCVNCQQPIEFKIINNRSTYYCQNCQK